MSLLSHCIKPDILFCQVVFHTPPQFPLEAIGEIRQGAAKLFQLLGLRDFARVDGWLLPFSCNINMNRHGVGKGDKLIGQMDSGIVVFSDINLVRKMNVMFYVYLNIRLRYPNYLALTAFHSKNVGSVSPPIQELSGDFKSTGN